MESGRSPPRVVLARSIDEYLRSRAASLIGNLGGPLNAAFVHDDLIQGGNATTPVGWSQTMSGSASSALNNIDEGAGVVQVTSGATAASIGALLTNGSALLRPDTQPFYFATRFKVTTAIDAQANVFVGTQAISGSKTVAVGVFGASSTVNFRLQYDGVVAGSFLDLGVAIDTAYHVYEVYGLGDGNLHVRMDFGVDKGPVAQAAAPTVASYLLMQAQNGTTAAARTMRTDWVAFMTKR